MTSLYDWNRRVSASQQRSLARRTERSETPELQAALWRRGGLAIALLCALVTFALVARAVVVLL